VKSLHDSAGDGEGATLDALFGLAEVLAAMMERGVAERGLTRARAGLLWALHHDGPVTQGALARTLGVTPRNVTGLLDALEASGLVSRSAHPSDRRATLVDLTAEGRETTTRLRAGRDELASHLFAHLTQPEREAFRQVLLTTTERLRAADPQPAPPSAQQATG
jgi:DNA-binding MarR family transcriptional regulator